MRQAVVVDQTDTEGDKHMVAYVVPEKDNHKKPAQIRSELSQKLPVYMLPGFYVYMDGLPFLANGKIDRLALPNPLFSENKKQDEFQTKLLSLNPVEEKVFDVIVSILKQDAIGFTDNIFVHGCNSLLAARIIALINEHFRVEIPIREIYNYPTASDLAGFIQARQNQSSPAHKNPVLDPSTLDYLSQFA
jgi:acyl carrier protein